VQTIPHRSPLRRAAAIASLSLLLAAPSLPAQADPSQAVTPQDMKPYTETIPGTNITFEMVPIPGGTFTIGSPDDEESRNDDEGPQRQVTIAPFWMGRCEVTWEEYDPFAFSLDLKKKKADNINLDAQKESEKKADAVSRPTPPYADETFGYGRKGKPVICITHHAAMEYTRWLTAKTGKTYRLPTEAEWEYAARAGTTTAYSFGDDIENIDEYAWYVENAETPQPVGKKKPNPWGLHDMHGNVAEWVLDHYSPEAYLKLDEANPTFGPVILPDEKEYPYLVRGGSWDDDPEALRSATRRASDKEWSVQDPQRPQSIWWHTDATFAGFRVVRPFKEQDNLEGLASKVVKQKGTK
jgi:formylglycine-generating enzyme required for sulfatase activity